MRTLLRSPACWTMPVTTSVTRSMYSSYIISRSASRMRWRMTCFAVCAAMRPKSSGVTSSRSMTSSGTSVRSIVRSSSVTRTCERSPVSSSCCSSAWIARSRASSTSRSSMSPGRSMEKTRKSPVSWSSSTVGVAGCARRLLVRGEQRVLERLDERAALDALLALDRLDAFDDLSGHFVVTSSIRLPRTTAS